MYVYVLKLIIQGEIEENVWSGRLRIIRTGLTMVDPVSDCTEQRWIEHDDSQNPVRIWYWKEEIISVTNIPKKYLDFQLVDTKILANVLGLGSLLFLSFYFLPNVRH